MSLQGGGSKPTSDATTTVPGSVLSDVAPLGDHPVALTKDGLPGVATDLANGLAVQGDVTVGNLRTGGIALEKAQNQVTVAGADGGSTSIGSNYMQMTLKSDNGGIEIDVPANSATAMFAIERDDISQYIRAYGDGSMRTSAGTGIWGHTAPVAQPVLATGAAHTVDDIIALLQSYGICKQA